MAADKQIAAPRADEAMMAAKRADPQILEKQLSIEATVETSRTNTSTCLAALNNSLWRFLEGSFGAFGEHYKFFSQRARAFLSSRVDRLVTGQAQATHHYKEGTHDVEASPSSKPIVINISDDEE
ncbi:hypothetical protein D1007_02131 [Hordeum vulgare]|nr:hypothetical protein D1007_02131 [Hordeum vulgare]